VAASRPRLRLPVVLAALLLIGAPILGATLGENAHRRAIAETCPATGLAARVVAVRPRPGGGGVVAAVALSNRTGRSCTVGGFYLPVGLPLPNEIVRVGPSTHQLLLASTTLRLAPGQRAAFLVVGADVPARYVTARGVLAVLGARPGNARVSVSPVFPMAKLSLVLRDAATALPS